MKTTRRSTHRAASIGYRRLTQAGLAALATLGVAGGMAAGASPASAASTAGQGAVSAAAASATVMPQGVFKGRGSDDLFYSNGKGQFEKLTFDAWKRIGYPTPTVLANSSVIFGKYAFSSNIYQLIQFGPNTYSVSPVSLNHWINAGAPTPRVLQYIPGARIEKYPTSPELYFYEPNETRFKLTPQMWAQTGYQQYTTLSNVGFQRLTWNDNVAYMSSVSAGKGNVIDFKQWADYGAPTPQQVKRFPGDSFYRYQNSDTVYYTGPTVNRTVTFNEWIAAGAPTPALRNSPGPTTSDLSKHAVVDLSDQKVYAYTGGKLINTFTVTTGNAQHPTRIGTFKVWHKTTSQTMTGGSKEDGTYYSVPNVQWVSYFDGDIAFHAAYWRTEFGGDPSVVGSHGCINMRTADAKWMYDFAGYGTKVVVQQ
ncbi:L,D-transpeptidase [Micrococcales bacterium 31B]|nr:L,D-transpeptidase [Micrococcales bacterium 31B]